jgi:hypothetical protein
LGCNACFDGAAGGLQIDDGFDQPLILACRRARELMDQVGFDFALGTEMVEVGAKVGFVIELAFPSKGYGVRTRHSLRSIFRDCNNEIATV